jgi:hypothetical protein
MAASSATIVAGRPAAPSIVPAEKAAARSPSVAKNESSMRSNGLAPGSTGIAGVGWGVGDGDGDGDADGLVEGFGVFPGRGVTLGAGDDEAAPTGDGDGEGVADGVGVAPVPPGW